MIAIRTIRLRGSARGTVVPRVGNMSEGLRSPSGVHDPVAAQARS
jgi:hypothetical protein